MKNYGDLGGFYPPLPTASFSIVFISQSASFINCLLLSLLLLLLLYYYYYYYYYTFKSCIEFVASPIILQICSTEI